VSWEKKEERNMRKT